MDHDPDKVEEMVACRLDLVIVEKTEVPTVEAKLKGDMTGGTTIRAV